MMSAASVRSAGSSPNPVMSRSVLVSGMASALSQATFGDGIRGPLCKLRIPCCGFQIEARLISAAHLFGV